MKNQDEKKTLRIKTLDHCEYFNISLFTVLSLFLFILHTSDFQYTPESCHLHRYSADFAAVGCISQHSYMHIWVHFPTEHFGISFHCVC